MRAQASLPELVAAVAGGDRAALRAVYEEESVRLFGIANAILRDRDAAAEALQDAFLRMSQRAAQFEAARGPAEAWLGGIVRHAALDLARRRGRELPSDNPAPGDAILGPGALQKLVAEPHGRRLRDCLAALDEKNRRGILLAFVHGLSHAQIAARLELPPGTVRAWIRRGLIQLRECLA